MKPRNDRILQAIQEGFKRGSVYDIYDSLMAHGYHIVSTPKWSLDERHPSYKLREISLDMDCDDVKISSRNLFHSEHYGVSELDRLTEHISYKCGSKLMKKLLDYET